MVFRHSLQTSRYELKFLIDEAQTLAIRDYLRRFLVPDPYTKPEMGNRYYVHSLYCDSRDLRLYRATQRGEKNRFKLRIRFYNDEPDQPAFLEIKRRIGTVIAKQRAAVSKEATRRFLVGHPMPLTALSKSERSGKQVAAMQEFCTLYHQIGARPCVYVSYSREAYVQPDSNNVRVTFDRQLFSGEYEAGRSMLVPRRMTRAFLPSVLLEVKFTDRYPCWLEGISAALNLNRISFAKYCKCVEAVGCPWLSNLGTDFRVDFGVAS